MVIVEYVEYLISVVDTMLMWLRGLLAVLAGPAIGFLLVWWWRAVRRGAAPQLENWLADRGWDPHGVDERVILDAADRTLGEMLADDTAAAAVRLRAAVEHADRTAVAAVLLRWCDTAIADAGLTGRDVDAIRTGSTHVVMSLRRVVAGEVVDDGRPIDEHPAPMVWAARLIAARVAGDRETSMALLDAVPSGCELGTHLGAALYLVTTTMRSGALIAGRPGRR